MESEKIEALFEELAKGQRGRLMEMGTKKVPHFTEDDLLQPCDYPELENSPHFRYEEGVLEGILMARAALLALHHDLSTD